MNIKNEKKQQRYGKNQFKERDKQTKEFRQEGRAKKANIPEIVAKIKELKSLSDLKANELNDGAKNFAESMTKELKTAQIRRIFGAVKKMQMEFKKEPKDDFKNDKVILLKPKIAYAASKKIEVEPLREILEAGIDRIGDNEKGYQDFETFVNLFEAILAYKGR